MADLFFLPSANLLLHLEKNLFRYDGWARVILQGEYFAPPLHDTISEIAFYGDIYGGIYNEIYSDISS